jgi:hypothetical protein
MSVSLLREFRRASEVSRLSEGRSRGVSALETMIIRAGAAGGVPEANPFRAIEEPHVNPRPNHREMWLRDPDGYVVVIASPDGEANT